MLGRRYSPSFLQGTRPRFASDTLMSLRAIPSFSLGYLVLQQRIYAPLRVSVFGVRCGPAGVAVDSRWFCVRPVPSELGRGRLSRFSLLPGGLVFCVWGCGERPCDTLRALLENVAAPQRFPAGAWRFRRPPSRHQGARSEARAGAPVGARRVPNLELIPPGGSWFGRAPRA